MFGPKSLTRHHVPSVYSSNKDMSQKVPTLIIYWGDTRVPLTYDERQMALNGGKALHVVCLTPEEVLLEHVPTKRKIVIRGVTDPSIPPLPPIPTPVDF